MTNYETSMRSHRCGDLRVDDVGKEVIVCGWVDRRREHGEQNPHQGVKKISEPCQWSAHRR